MGYFQGTDCPYLKEITSTLEREKGKVCLLLCHLFLHIAPRVKGVSVSSPNVFINSFQILASEGHGQMQLWTC